ESGVQTGTVRLLVDPQLITSWGYFALKKGEGPPKPGEEVVGEGVGFAQEITDPKVNKGAPVMLPVSSEHPVTAKRVYADPSPPYPAPKPYGTARIDVGNKIKAIADDPSGASENRGRFPEEVMLITEAVFD